MTLPAPRLDEDDERPAAAVTALPPLPFEYHVVGTARALEAAKTKCDLALVILQFAAREEAQVFNMLHELQLAAANAVNAYSAYSELINCKGRA